MLPRLYGCGNVAEFTGMADFPGHTHLSLKSAIESCHIDAFPSFSQLITGSSQVVEELSLVNGDDIDRGIEQIGSDFFQPATLDCVSLAGYSNPTKISFFSRKKTYFVWVATKLSS